MLALQLKFIVGWALVKLIGVRTMNMLECEIRIVFWGPSSIVFRDQALGTRVKMNLETLWSQGRFLH